MPYTPHNQRKSKDNIRDSYDWITLGTAIVGVIVVAGSSLVSLWNTMLVRDQVRVMERDQRPWVELENIDIQSPLTLEPVGGRVDLRFNLKNVGRSPAFKARVKFDFLLRDQTLSKVVNAQAALCPADGGDAKSPYEGITIFPEQTRPSNGWITFSSLTIRDWHAGLATEAAFPMIYGCVDYVFASGEHHQTGFIYEITRKAIVDGKPTDFGTIDPGGGTVPAGDVQLAENPGLIAPTN